MYVCIYSASHLVVSNSLGPHGLWTARVFCPWDFPGKNTGVGFYFLLQGIFLAHRSNPCLLHLLNWQADSLSLHQLGSPIISYRYNIKYYFPCDENS